MKNLLVGIVATFLLFHGPKGSPMWVDHEAITAVLQNDGGCISPTKSQVVTANGTYCVREDPEEVMKAITNETHEPEEEEKS